MEVSEQRGAVATVGRNAASEAFDLTAPRQPIFSEPRGFVQMGGYPGCAINGHLSIRRPFCPFASQSRRMFGFVVVLQERRALVKTMAASFFQDEDINYPPEYRPAFPGGPGHPPHPRMRRYAYLAVGVALALTSGLGNTLIQDNQGQLLGALGAEANEIAWVPTAYVMSFATMNLLLVRFRQQFGLRLYALISLVLFTMFTAAHAFVTGVGGAIFIHALAGFSGASLLALSIYYVMEFMASAHASKAAVLSLSLSQVPIAMSRLIDPEKLAFGDWQALYVMELGIALMCLVAVLWLRLPPGVRSQAFEPLDFIAYPLLAGGMALVIAVIGMGRYEWWTDHDWLGWALVAAIPMLTVAVYIEAHRTRPLLDVRWLYRNELLRFGLVVIILRIVLAEQSLVFGFLAGAGILNDELVTFCAALSLSAIAGAVTSAMVFEQKRILAMGVVAFALIAVAAAMDCSLTSLTRAPQLYATQMTISFATTFAIGPTLVFAQVPVARAHGTTLTSYVVLFAIAQNVGGLAGISLLGSLQTIFEKANSVALIDRVRAFDPVVQARIVAGGGGEHGVAALQAAMSHEAGTLAYGNVFGVVALIAAAVAVYMLTRLLFWPPASLPSSPPSPPALVHS
ncbi:MFS transporter [Sphingomonas nostoxanthinifaciens]|uniref:MFS transporter n=1 Tax=Sphingomonas nostoxanthinifaciens TaxID=2872652 RepID=UPI001CC1FAB0|nr:MFS transporter [Sphingomonas nostoxanthinifaciens]UAK26278.1 MFS transporter [Sphingomonas nostoxanthinifaciens]